jgi:hypothetical protein
MLVMVGGKCSAVRTRIRIAVLAHEAAVNEPEAAHVLLTNRTKELVSNALWSYVKEELLIVFITRTKSLLSGRF